MILLKQQPINESDWRRCYLKERRSAEFGTNCPLNQEGREVECV